MQTRLEKATRHDAIVVAGAALDRLALGDRIDERLSLGDMLPQVGQAALAVECRADDDVTRRRVTAIDDADVRDAVEAERAFLRQLGSGCSLPVAAHATIVSDRGVQGRAVAIDGLIASYDGARVCRTAMMDADPEAAGSALAEGLQHVFGAVA